MMFNKFSVFALLAVTLLAVSVIGHPTTEASAENGDKIEETGTTVKSGIHSWLKKVQAKIVKSHDNCTHGGGVIHWVKNKLGFAKTTTTTETPTTTAETDYSGYHPVTSVVGGAPQGETEEGYGGDDITILDDAASVNPGDVSDNESASVDTTSSITENSSYSEDPSIDVRMQSS
ncbi:uncharacterized protein LOC113548279 [Rhopalosiphum maidis]|uniref:uncharacterized protein LOC113548279 n=1 Tax=Rhopalosiphum maidis TaxID=43146 RepID=UPI000EFF390F|nr:uncharacterized protein LOC113548279 [Rhopalosiphum maidis]